MKCNLRPNKASPRLNERGDTIIEVLIAIAIVSLVLVTSYALTNKSVLSISNAQEQTQAQKLTEQQVEFLRASATPPTTAGCFNASNGSYVTPETDPVCVQTISSAEYHTKVSYADPTYTVSTSWEMQGGQNAKVTIYYRIGS